MVHVVVTGGAGFLGARLAREILKAGTLGAAGGPPGQVTKITLIDQAPAPADLAADDRVTAVRSDLTELGSGALGGADVVFHLAAAVSAECEADFDLGIHANLHGTEALLAACRALGTSPVVVYASSAAAFGGSPEHPLPPVIDDQTLPVPQTSYGAQKVIGEYLLADYARKGYLRGRALRLMTVTVRPGRPNRAASGWVSGIIREPLAGQRASCPVPPDTRVAVASPAKAVTALLRAAISSERTWGDSTPVTMPALTVSAGEMAAALERVAGPEASALIDWAPDPVITAMMRGWPARVKADRAARLGLTPDPDFDSIIRLHLAERS